MLRSEGTEAVVIAGCATGNSGLDRGRAIERERTDLEDLEVMFLDVIAELVWSVSRLGLGGVFEMEGRTRTVVRCMRAVDLRPRPHVLTEEIACDLTAVLYHFPTFAATPVVIYIQRVLSLSWQPTTNMNMEVAGPNAWSSD